MARAARCPVAPASFAEGGRAMRAAGFGGSPGPGTGLPRAPLYGRRAR